MARRPTLARPLAQGLGPRLTLHAMWPAALPRGTSTTGPALCGGPAVAPSQPPLLPAGALPRVDSRWLAARRTGVPEPPGPPQSVLGSFPDPATIEGQQVAYLRDLDAQVQQQEALLAHRHAAALEFLRARCEQQKKHLCCTIEQEVQMLELQANARCSELRNRLAQEATRRNLELEKQAHALELECRTRRVQQELTQEDVAVRRRYFETTSPEATTGVLAHSSGGQQWFGLSSPLGADGSAQTLHVVVHGAYGLGVPPGAPRDAPADTYATTKVGQHRQRTGPAFVMADPSSPIWERDNNFVFRPGRHDFLLELEVDKKAGFLEVNVGRLSLDLRGISPGQWQRFREPLHGGPGGELEFDVCLLRPSDQDHAPERPVSVHEQPLTSAHHSPMAPMDHPAIGQQPSSASGPQPGATLQVIVHGARNLLNRDTGIFGDYSDPYVVCQVGKNKHQTPTVDNNLNPSWSTDNQFNFQLGKKDKTLELQVFNSNTMRADQSLGTTSVDLLTLRPGETRRLYQPLLDVGQGELEFSVCLRPGQSPGGAAAVGHLPTGGPPLTAAAAGCGNLAPSPSGCGLQVPPTSYPAPGGCGSQAPPTSYDGGSGMCGHSGAHFAEMQGDVHGGAVPYETVPPGTLLPGAAPPSGMKPPGSMQQPGTMQSPEMMLPAGVSHQSGAVQQDSDGSLGGANLHVVVYRASNLLNRDTGLMGDYSDPYVNCKVGKTTHRTPTINDNLNPEWPHDNPFTFSIGKKRQATRYRGHEREQRAPWGQQPRHHVHPPEDDPAHGVAAHPREA